MNEILLYADQILLFCRELKEEFDKYSDEMDMDLIFRSTDSIELAARNIFKIANNDDMED